MKLENKWFSMKLIEAQGKASEAEIFVYDEIGGWGISANSFIDQLKALGDVETINLRINSPGGSVIAGNTIYNAIKRHSARVVTHIDGLAASMGSVIAMAGDEIHMADNALFMYHNPWTVAMGDAEDLRKNADLLDTMKETILNAYSRTGISREDLSAQMDAETWLTAKEAKSLKFVDVIDNAMEQAASIDETQALAKSKELIIPVDKIIESINSAHAQEIADLNSELTSATNQLAENAVELAKVQELKELLKSEQQEVAEFMDKIKTLEIAHAEALEAAQVVTAEAVAIAAAEKVCLQSSDPVIIDGNNEVEKTDADILQTWKSIEDRDERVAFFSENKAAIYRAQR